MNQSPLIHLTFVNFCEGCDAVQASRGQMSPETFERYGLERGAMWLTNNPYTARRHRIHWPEERRIG